MKRVIASLLLAVAALGAAPAAMADVFVSVQIAPPPLPVYEQPPCPAPGYIWVPGYWAWDADFDSYYWVPGTWVPAPQPGLYWTPGYWAWNGGFYVWHPGYWAPQVGYYGGIDYGFGYFGVGYVGGYWRGPHFYYNQVVNNINVTVVRNVYVDRTVVRNVVVDRVSFNGPGGVERRPTPAELRVERERHWRPTPLQIRHLELAREDRAQFASFNHGRPPVLATPAPAEFRRAGAQSPRALGPGQLEHGPWINPRIEPKPIEHRPPDRGLRRDQRPTAPMQGFSGQAQPAPVFERRPARPVIELRQPRPAWPPGAGPNTRPWQAPPTRAPMPESARAPARVRPTPVETPPGRAYGHAPGHVPERRPVEHGPPRRSPPTGGVWHHVHRVYRWESQCPSWSGGAMESVSAAYWPARRCRGRTRESWC